MRSALLGFLDAVKRYRGRFLAVACAMFIIPLAWMIPMTVHTWGIYQGNKNNTVAFTSLREYTRP